jgi:hypothetical protein
VTTKSAKPAACGGDVKVKELLLVQVTLVPGLPPKSTVTAGLKLLPVTVITVPPETLPWVTLMLVSSGGAWVGDAEKVGLALNVGEGVGETVKVWLGVKVQL